MQHEPIPDCLAPAEQAVLDGLAVSVIDDDITTDELADRILLTATLLGCTPVQAAAEGAKVAASVLTHTPRYDDGGGSAEFDIDYVRECLERNSAESAQLRPASWRKD